MSQRVRIPGGESLSDPFSIRNSKVVGIMVPACWTAAGMQFQAGSEKFVTKPLYDQKGQPVSAVPAADSFLSMTDTPFALSSAVSVRIRSGSHSVPVPQEGETASSATADFGGGKILTVTSGVKGTRSDDIVCVFEMNETDTLSVTNPQGRDVVVKLACATAAKNTAALIEAAVRALGTVDGVDVSALTVSGNGAYNASPPAGVKASKTIVVDNPNGKALTFTYGLGGSQGNGLEFRIENNSEDVLSVMNPAETVQILIRMATATGSKNAAAAIEAAVQALGSIGSYDVSSLTVSGSTSYNAAPPAGVKGQRTVTYFDGSEASLGALTATAGVVGPEGRTVVTHLISGVTVNDSDTLNVSLLEDTQVEYPVAVIKLANGTPVNNSAANILAALKSLVPTGTDYDDYISSMTLTGDAVWNASPPVTAPATYSADEGVQGTLPLSGTFYSGTTANGDDLDTVTGVLSGGVDCWLELVTKD